MSLQWPCMVHPCMDMLIIGAGSKDAVDMRSMEVERRLRGGEQMSECWREPGGFEKYTKVSG